jgi:S-adenosylmethionine decarboxylase
MSVTHAAEARGDHLLIELSGCTASALCERDGVRAALLAAAAAAGATVVGESLHGFSPHGVTGILLLAGSHMSIHTWPEANYAAIDVYTGGGGHPELAVAVLARHFEAAEVEVLWIERGSDGAGRRMRLRPAGDEGEVT